MSATDLETRRKRLLYRAQHRGFKEADLWIGSFALARLPTMTAEELDAFEHLIEVLDDDLYAWVAGRAPAPSEYEGPMLDELRAFSVSDALAAARE